MSESDLAAAQQDYEESWGRLFPEQPREGWYWQSHGGYPVYVYVRERRWWSIEIVDASDLRVRSGMLAPGLFEQLVALHPAARMESER